MIRVARRGELLTVTWMTAEQNGCIQVGTATQHTVVTCPELRRSPQSLSLRKQTNSRCFNMHLMYYLDEQGDRVYTLKVWEGGGGLLGKSFDGFYLHGGVHSHIFLLFLLLQKETPDKKRTESAHPARFSPDDKFSRQRVACKKRFGLYLPDLPQKPL